ncbi:MAG: glucose-6-phosphate isomerase [Candidatus Methanoperedens sp.]|nr:glucose-6-phosphate isomerase [Candidatus Methanoperedens sp.]
MELTLDMISRGVKPGIRMLSDMKDVIYDRNWLSSAGNSELYYMYRELSLSKKDAAAMKEHGLRYDITIIPPQMLGCEFVKTAGHYHPLVPGTQITYPEIYEVLGGEATYMLQKPDNEGINDVILVKAGAGDKVIIPPGYGHLTINTSNKVLKMANWVARDFESIYQPIKEKGGGAYFILDKGMVKNPRYGHVPEIKPGKPANLKEIGLQKSKEMYGLVRDLKNLEFLTKPHEHAWVFEEVLGK